jgi:hypothetical protein
VYHHFALWRRDGVFAIMLKALRIRLDDRGLIDWDLWCIDGADVRATRAAAGAGKEAPTGTRFDKLAVNFRGMIQLAIVHRYLRLLSSDSA